MHCMTHHANWMQIQQRVDAYKAALKHGTAPHKAQELQSRLDALLADHTTRQAEHISTARQRQRLLQHTVGAVTASN